MDRRREGRTEYLWLGEGGGRRGLDRTPRMVPPEMIDQESRNSWDEVEVTAVVTGRSFRAAGLEEEESAESGLSARGPSSTVYSPSDHCENDPTFEGPGSAPSKNGKEGAVEGSDLIT